MFSSRSYWFLFFTCFSLAIFAEWRDRTKGSRPKFLTAPRAQNAILNTQDLLVEEDSLPERSTKARPLPSVIYGPVRIETGPDGHLFVIDDGAGEVIREFSPTGQLLHEFIGRDVPHISSVTDLAILPDKLFVADLLGSSIHSLNRVTGAWATVRVNPAPYRLETLGAYHERLLVTRVLAPQLFYITRADGSVQASFGKLLEDQEFHSLALDGFITHSKNSVIFAGKYLGVLASFFEDGRTNWLTSQLLPPDEPIIMEKGRSRWVRHGPMPAAISIAATADKVCVLTRRVSGLQVHFFLDLYRANDGSYYRSLLLPTTYQWTSVTLTEAYLYIANGQAIVQWPSYCLDQREHQGLQLTGRPIISFKTTKQPKGDPL